MPNENISALSNLSEIADADEVMVRDASAPAQPKALAMDVLRAGMQSGLVEVTSATLSITKALHGGKTLVLNRTGGIDMTLPEATGSGDRYRFFVAAATADAYTVATADPSNCDIAGNIVGSNDSDASATLYRDTDATSLSFGGTSQARGGSVGDWFELVDVAVDLWGLKGAITQGGTEATPIIA